MPDSLYITACQSQLLLQQPNLNRVSRIDKKHDPTPFSARVSAHRGPDQLTRVYIVGIRK